MYYKTKPIAHGDIKQDETPIEINSKKYVVFAFRRDLISQRQIDNGLDGMLYLRKPNGNKIYSCYLAQDGSVSRLMRDIYEVSDLK